MSRRFAPILAPLLIAAVAAGCGVAPRDAAGVRTSVATAQSVSLDELDLTMGQPRRQTSPAALNREGRAVGERTIVFPTHVVAASGAKPHLRAAAGPVVTGVLRYPDFTGKLIPAANVTVHLAGRNGSQEIGTAVTDASGRWTAELPAAQAGQAAAATYELGNRRWTITKYRWAGPAIAALEATNDTGERTLDPASQNSKAGLIHQIWNRALAAFERENIPTDAWWTRPINTNWPASGNFYSMGAVNLTDAEWWDVNGHEIGHALFFAGFNSASGGGQHKIDACYGADLAWSEGFASFFSAMISLERDDADAKFEFMVPRRKPIRMENVPSDVCEGPTNEWRAGAAMWDLYDTHNDGTDQVALDFAPIWGALVKTGTPGRMNDVTDAFKRIAAARPAAERPGLVAAFAQAGVPVSF